MSVLDNSTRGVWSITDVGRTISAEEVDRRFRAQRAERLKKRRDKRQLEIEDPEDSAEEDTDWKSNLLALLLDLAPEKFERLARRLLREAGFISVTVTGQTGDGGIDGVGVYRLSLVSFPVFFQCKRYKGSVRASAVRDFRGAMSGRGDKGLLITTGTFTADAKSEATRDGAPPIDLIDGDKLCDLLKEYAIGVRRQVRQIEDIEVVPSDFDDI